MRRLALLAVMALAGCAGHLASKTAPLGKSSVTFGLDTAGQPYCDPGATVKKGSWNGARDYVVCTWSCAMLGGQQASWEVIFGRAAGDTAWAVYMPAAIGACVPLAPSADT